MDFPTKHKTYPNCLCSTGEEADRCRYHNYWYEICLEIFQFSIFEIFLFCVGKKEFTDTVK